MPAPGLIVAAPASGSGKTVVTLGLLRHLARQGAAPTSAKVGPDYIDPAFHAAATGRPCPNLDGWAMRPATLAATVATLGQDAGLLVCEGVMGLFDGANVPAGEADGSTAALAALTGWPVVLVIDAARQAGSAGALLAGFARHRADVHVAGVILNRTGGEAHREMLERACRAVPEVAVLGFIPRDAALELPSRHLGLVQAGETADLGAFLDAAAGRVATHVDVAALTALARPARLADPGDASPPLPPLGQRIGVARDEAFAFAYAGVLAGWRRAGAEILPFSPLADEAPAAEADAVYLPGGYPELHAGRLAANRRFLSGLRAAAERGAAVYGECGGYMALGRVLTDAAGTAHRMADLLPVETSFARRRLHLGYRRAEAIEETPLGPAGARYRGHEFHYASVVAEGAPLFRTADAAGRPLPASGSRQGKVAGSFLHLIDRG